MTLGDCADDTLNQLRYRILYRVQTLRRSNNNYTKADRLCSKRVCFQIKNATSMFYSAHKISDMCILTPAGNLSYSGKGHELHGKT